MDTNKLFGDDARLLDETSLSVLEKLPESAWGSLVECTDEYLAVGDMPGLDCRLVSTRETLDDFLNARANHWQEPGRVEEITTEAGIKALHFQCLQTRKGEQRTDMVVIDFGETRISLL